MQANRFSTPSSKLVTKGLIGISAFMLAVSAEPADSMACERVASLLLTMEQQQMLENTKVSERLGFDQMVGLGYVDPSSQRPKDGNWDKVSFTGKNGVYIREHAIANESKIFSEFLSQQWESLQQARDKGIFVLGTPVDDKTLLTLSGTKGVSWVIDYAEGGSPAAMLDDLPPAVLRVIGGEGPERILQKHIEISEIDLVDVVGKVEPLMRRGDLPVSFEKMVGMGIIPVDTKRPSGPEDYAAIKVSLGRDNVTLDDLVSNDEMRSKVVMMFVSEVQEDLKSSWKGSEHITPEEALQIASLRGVSEAVRISVHGPDLEDEIMLDMVEEEISLRA